MNLLGIVCAAMSLQCAEPTLTVEAFVAPIKAAIAAEKARQATLPPTSDVGEQLVRMAQMDQRARDPLDTLDFSLLPEVERERAHAAIWAEIDPVDRANQARLLELAPAEGWFHPSVYGERPAAAAFLIVQHSNADLWRRFVPVLEPLARAGEIDGQDYALMYDRLALSEGRPQRYGSQMVCRDGRYVVNTLEAPEGVDARRAELGMGPLAEYEAIFTSHPRCG